MVIYIDQEYKCHVSDEGTMTGIETDAFEGKCAEYIEGFRYVPEGESWTREDGEMFTGVMVSPWKPHSKLDEVQRAYEQELAQAARILLGEV